MPKKRSNKYDKPMQLKDGVQFDDLFKLSLKPSHDKPAPKKKAKKK